MCIRDSYNGDNQIIYNNDTIISSDFYNNIQTPPLNESQLFALSIGKFAETIEENTFSDFNNLSSLIFIDNGSLTNIKQQSFFDCSNLNSILFPRSLTEIGIQAFQDCNNLTSVDFNIQPNLLKIDSQAFANTTLTSIIIPGSVTEIGNNAFLNLSLIHI